MKRVFITAGLLAVLCSSSLYAQENPPPDLEELTLEQLMQIPIVSASRSVESSFEAPISSYVITRQDIINSGATSIPEALRLAPGLIVRELSTGSYDVSIRGGKDNLPSHQFYNTNTSILAMINNQPIFNYLSGGTRWQNLPIDVADIDRIEIVYGPNSPLYGPNAVDGVINILTRKNQNGEKTYGSAVLQAGTGQMFSALAGVQVSDKLEVNLSANYSLRKRYVQEYYDPATHTFVDDLRDHSSPRFSSDPYLYFPDPEIASRHNGFNFNLYYKPAQKTTITVNTAYNDNTEVGNSGGISTIAQWSNRSMNHLVKLQVSQFTIQSSVMYGKQGMGGNVTEQYQNYMTSDTYVDYNWSINNKLSLRPAFSYQNARFDDEEYTVKINRTGVFNNNATMYNYALSLKGDYKPVDRLRFIAAIRSDKFKAPDEMYISYQGIVNYRLNDKNILRFLAGKSFSGSFIAPTYIDVYLEGNPFLNINVQGNTDLRLMQNRILELGFRSQLSRNVSIDASVFRQSYKDFSAEVTQVVKPPVFQPFEKGELEVVYQNIALEAVQTGVTVAGNILVGKVSIRPSITWQQNDLTNYSPYYNRPDPFLYPVYNTDNVVDKKSPFTPSLFGGFVINAPVKKFNFNVSGYYYGKYELHGLHGVNVNTGEVTVNDIDRIASKVLVNANVAYDFTRDFRAFVNIRNILGETAREGNGTDQIGRSIFAGVKIEL